MKKLLQILGAVVLTGTATSSAVACGTPPQPTPDPIDPTLIEQSLQAAFGDKIKAISIGGTVNYDQNGLGLTDSDITNFERDYKYLSENTDVLGTNAQKVIDAFNKYIANLGDFKKIIGELKNSEEFGTYFKNVDNVLTINADKTHYQKDSMWWNGGYKAPNQGWNGTGQPRDGVKTDFLASDSNLNTPSEYNQTGEDKAHQGWFVKTMNDITTGHSKLPGWQDIKHLFKMEATVVVNINFRIPGETKINSTEFKLNDMDFLMTSANSRNTLGQMIKMGNTRITDKLAKFVFQYKPSTNGKTDTNFDFKREYTTVKMSMQDQLKKAFASDITDKNMVIKDINPIVGNLKTDGNKPVYEDNGYANYLSNEYWTNTNGTPTGTAFGFGANYLTEKHDDPSNKSNFAIVGVNKDKFDTNWDAQAAFRAQEFTKDFSKTDGAWTVPTVWVSGQDKLVDGTSLFTWSADGQDFANVNDQNVFERGEVELRNVSIGGYVINNWKVPYVISYDKDRTNWLKDLKAKSEKLFATTTDNNVTKLGTFYDKYSLLRRFKQIFTSQQGLLFNHNVDKDEFQNTVLNKNVNYNTWETAGLNKFMSSTFGDDVAKQTYIDWSMPSVLNYQILLKRDEMIQQGTSEWWRTLYNSIMHGSESIKNDAKTFTYISLAIAKLAPQLVSLKMGGMDFSLEMNDNQSYWGQRITDTSK